MRTQTNTRPETADIIEQGHESARKRTVQKKIIWSCLIVTIALNIAARCSKEFAAFYTDRIFPIISLPFSYINGKLPFSLGELLIAIGILALVLTIILLPTLLIIKRKNKDTRRKIRRVFGYFYAWVLVFVMVTETFGCFIQYRAPTFAEKYGMGGSKYTQAQLIELTDYIADNLNKTAKQVKRDGKGRFVPSVDLKAQAIKNLQALSKKYPQLEGFYPEPKYITCSRVMSKQSYLGIYFPFSAEANINKEMPDHYKPDTMCHELAHLKGIILEDEASFIAFLACEQSDSADFRYSGYLNAFDYCVGKIKNRDKRKAMYEKINDEVRNDWRAEAEFWDKIFPPPEEDDSIISAQTINEISDKATEASLKLNGVEDGMESYGRMVDLMLDWYYEDKTK